MLYTKKFKFNYKPLEYVETIEVIGTVPSVQQFDADFREWSPDYSLKVESEGVNVPVSPLVLQPHIIAHDLNDGSEAEINELIASTMSWTKIYKNGNTFVEQALSNPSNDYHIITSGPDAGRLTIMKNVDANTEVTFRFSAYHVDAKTNHVHEIKMDFPVTCFIKATPTPNIVADCDASFVWNPFRENATRVITVKLMRGEREITDVTFHWQRKRANGTWSDFGAVPYLDLGYAISQNTKTLTQDMTLMGRKLDIRVWAEYGDITSFVDGTPFATFTLVRRLPSYEAEFVGVPDNIEPGTQYVFPILVVRDNIGVLENPMQELSCVWKRALAAASGEQTYEDIASGKEPMISTDIMNNGDMILGFVLEDKGPKAAVALDSSHLDTIVLHDNKVVLSR